MTDSDLTVTTDKAHTAHTPGPWRFAIVEVSGRKERRLFAPGQGLDPDDYLRGADAIMGDTNYYPWTPDELADWHLIAAAPELFEALKMIHDSFGGGLAITFSASDAEQIRAAIAKALGQ